MTGFDLMHPKIMSKNAAEVPSAVQMRRDTARANKIAREKILHLRKVLVQELKLKLEARRYDVAHGSSES